MKISLYELFTLCDLDHVDIADNTYDFIVNFSCYYRKDKCKDNYNKLMRYFATQIECNSFNINDKIAHCFISEFINNRITAFNQFMYEFNREEYKPNADVKKDTDAWYDLYMTTFECIVNGDYNDIACGKLLKLLGGM